MKSLYKILIKEFIIDIQFHFYVFFGNRFTTNNASSHDCPTRTLKKILSYIA